MYSVDVQLQLCVSGVAVCLILVNISLYSVDVQLQLSVSGIAVQFVLVYVCLYSVDVSLQDVVGSDACSFLVVDVVLQCVSDVSHLAVSRQVAGHRCFICSNVSIDGQIAVDDSVVVQSRLPSDCERTAKINCPRNRKVSIHLRITEYPEFLRGQQI